MRVDYQRSETKMELLNERNQVKDVISSFVGRRGNEAQRKLSDSFLTLDPEEATAEQVGEIAGHDQLIYAYECHECGKESWDIVQLGEPFDYESCTANICGDCLRKALQLLENSA